MSIIGYAAVEGIFLDIPQFLRGLGLCLDKPDGPALRLTQEMYDEVERLPDPNDPTEMVDEYYKSWWMQSEHCSTDEPPLVEIYAAIQFHMEKVSFLAINIRSYLTRRLGPSLERLEVRTHCTHGFPHLLLLRLLSHTHADQKSASNGSWP